SVAATASCTRPKYRLLEPAGTTVTRGSAGICRNFGSVAFFTADAFTSCITYPWINCRIQDIRSQIYGCKHQRAHRDCSLHDGVVEIGNRVDHESPDTWPRKHKLNRNSAPHQDAELQRNECDDGQQGIFQGMPIDDYPLRNSLDASKLDVLGLQNLR